VRACARFGHEVRYFKALPCPEEARRAVSESADPWASDVAFDVSIVIFAGVRP